MSLLASLHRAAAATLSPTAAATLGPKLGLNYRDRLLGRAGVAAIMAQRQASETFRHLWDAEISVYSQWGEDGILNFLCELLDLQRPTAIEFGAGNFRECNTRFLAEYRNSAVLAVDGRRDLVSSVLRSELSWRTTVIPVQEWITPVTAPQLFERALSEFGEVDIVSLDIDGNDYWVLESLPLDSVKILVVEFNALFGAKKAVSIPRNDHFVRNKAHYSGLYYGASLPAFVRLADRAGLTFVGTNRSSINAFFVQADSLAPSALMRPDPTRLEMYVRRRLRDSRDTRGRLSYLNEHQQLGEIAALPLVDVQTGASLTVGSAVSDRDS